MGAYALGSLAALLLALGGWDYYRDIQHQQDIARLATDLSAAGDRVSANAAEEIQGAASKALNAVYLVARKEGANETGQATAWAFEPDRLATNAHVTEAIKGHEKEFVLIAPNGERIAIERVESHPGYLAFKAYKATQGRMSGDSFKPLDVINEYDVGIIYPAGPLPPDPATGAPVTLDLATEDEIAALEPTEAVAMVGFPIEGLAATMVVTEAPSTVQFGYISRLTDVFMCKADPDHRLLIQHSVPVTGGVSGSPLIDKSGKVIGIVNGGNTASVLKTAAKDKDPDQAKTDEAAQPETFRIPNAALINFAQRIDLLDELRTGAAARELAADEEYWDQAAKKFVNYFASATNDFVALAAERYGVSGASGRGDRHRHAHPAQARGDVVRLGLASLCAGARTGVRVHRRGQERRAGRAQCQERGQHGVPARCKGPAADQRARAGADRLGDGGQDDAGRHRRVELDRAAGRLCVACL